MWILVYLSLLEKLSWNKKISSTNKETQDVELSEGRPQENEELSLKYLRPSGNGLL